MLPSYFDLMRAFLTLHDGEKGHNLEAQIGLPSDHPDYQRIIRCSNLLRTAKAEHNEGDMPYTVFCQQHDGAGTTHIETVMAKDAEEAKRIGRNNCAVDWGWNEEDIHVLGVVTGPAEVCIWADVAS